MSLEAAPPPDASQEKGAAGAPGQLPAPRRPLRPNSKEIPKEAKVSFGIGISLLAFIALLPWVLAIANRVSSDTSTPAPAATPTPGPAGSSNATSEGLKPRGSSGSSDGGGGRGGVGDGTVGRPAAEDLPFSATDFAVLRGLKAIFFDASQNPRAKTGLRVSEGDLPFGALEGASPEVRNNLELAQNRLAPHRVVAFRVLSEERFTSGTTYGFEVVIDNGDGERLAARGRVEIEQQGTESARVTRFEPLTPFAAPTVAPDAPPPAPHVATTPVGGSAAIQIPVVGGGDHPTDDSAAKFPFTIE